MFRRKRKEANFHPPAINANNVQMQQKAKPSICRPCISFGRKLVICSLNQIVPTTLATNKHVHVVKVSFAA
jgi:hypothetical protein